MMKKNFVLVFLLAMTSFSLCAFGKVIEPAYDASKFVGEPIVDASGKLQYVLENKSQTHSKENFVTVRVKGIKASDIKAQGRIRLALWNSITNYAKEGVNPYRACSHWAKDNVNGEMVFKIGGLEKGKTYSFFAHFDKENRGFVRKILGIPTEPFIFSNAANQGKGPGLTREGLSPPKFENTLVTFTGPGQEVILEFK